MSTILIDVTASGVAARVIAEHPSAEAAGAGKFRVRCKTNTRLGELIEQLGLSDQPLLCIVNDRSIANDERSELLLADDMPVALMPPIRAG